MSTRDEIGDRDAFAERLRVQLHARHPRLGVAVDRGRYGLRLTGQGIDSRLALEPLHAACLREPARTAELIADFVRRSEGGLAPAAPAAVPLARLIWCVRTAAYLAEHSRDQDLLLRPVAGSLVAFAAERLPNSIMRGVPREEWIGHGEAAVEAATAANTARQFARVAQRIRETARVPRDGWQFNGDALFQGSLLLVPGVLAALVERCGGDVLLATPDRSLLLAVAAAAPTAEAFHRRVRRTWREALNPCSAEVVRTDGQHLFALAPPSPGPRGGLLRMFDRPPR